MYVLTVKSKKKVWLMDKHTEKCKYWLAGFALIPTNVGKWGELRSFLNSVSNFKFQATH